MANRRCGRARHFNIDTVTVTYNTVGVLGCLCDTCSALGAPQTNALQTLTDQMPTKMNKDVRDWVVGAERALATHESGQWKKSHRTFSAWLEAEAARLGIKPRMLWRELGALRFYKSLGAVYAGLKFPDIIRGRYKPAAHHLELIEKISRSADDAVVRDLVNKAIHGQLPRSELTTLWDVYRSVDELKPRQGRDVSKSDRAARSSMLRTEPTDAGALVTLRSAGAAWLGIDKPDLYRFIIIPTGIGRQAFQLDAVVVLRAARDGPFVVHGLEVVSVHSLKDVKNRRSVVRLLAQAAKYCDCTWLVVATGRGKHGPQLEIVCHDVPARFGIAVVVENQVHVMRAPELHKSRHARELLAHLLAASTNF